jgi:hypothetical protein
MPKREERISVDCFNIGATSVTIELVERVEV